MEEKQTQAAQNDDTGFWHDEQIRVRPDRVVGKIRNRDGSFRSSVIIPTVMYPLSGTPEVFSFRNTRPIEDEAVLEIVDSIKYRIGFCYQNTEAIVSALRKAGYDARPYVGWIFTGSCEYPVHHCWTVLGNSVIDLGDDFTVMLSGENGERFKDCSPEEIRELTASFLTEAMTKPNRIRCYPVGMPTPFLYYVGSECEPEKGRRIYNELMAKYPNHESQRNVNPSTGLNKQQTLYVQRGLMDISSK